MTFLMRSTMHVFGARSRRTFLSCVLLSAVPASALHHPVAVRPVCHTVRAQVPLLTLDEDASKSMKAIPPPQNMNMAGLSGSVVPTRSFEAAVGDITAAETTDEYRRGLATVAFITLLFASNSPALRAAFTTVEHVPPVLLLNAAVSCAALSSLVAGGSLLDAVTDAPSSLSEDATDAVNAVSIRAGVELGLLKALGTSANLLGLSLTSAGHGAFLIQLTTLIVPVVQGVCGVSLSNRIWAAVAVALSGLLLFTADGASASSTLSGDLACVFAACFYAAYDLRLFVWGKRVTPLRLITNKVAAQAFLSLAILLLLGVGEATDFASEVSAEELSAVVPLVLWSGVVVNGIAPFLQVGGQQAIGPARAQVIYASGPLWAALISLFALGEVVGPQGMVGGAAFLAAVFLAATADAPDPDCPDEICEV